jgi:regulator of sigma E protease
MGVGTYVLAALGLAVLMVVHEGGHYLAARRYGMRVVKFSIGFGPTLWKHKPKGSPTVYQIAIIPFLAYVQIAGMNPYEENDPKDPGSYMNASLWARIVTITAGPLTNYLFASVLFFAGFLVGGRTIQDDTSMRVSVEPERPAAVAQIHDGDKVVSVDGVPVKTWDELKKAVSSHPGQAIDIQIDRDGQTLHAKPTPEAAGAKNAGTIGVRPYFHTVPVGVGEAAVLSLVEPPRIVYELVSGLVRMITGREKPELSGPVGIVKETAKAVKLGPGPAFQLLGALSAYLGGFNLLPVPALDGGRLIFLFFEAIARRKPDAKVEAQVHFVGLVMMLGLILFVTYFDFLKHGGDGAVATRSTPRSRPRSAP